MTPTNAKSCRNEAGITAPPPARAGAAPAGGLPVVPRSFLAGMCRLHHIRVEVIAGEVQGDVLRASVFQCRVHKVAAVVVFHVVLRRDAEQPRPRAEQGGGAALVGWRSDRGSGLDRVDADALVNFVGDAEFEDGRFDCDFDGFVVVLVFKTL